jgi:hypothetical protein
VLKSEIWVKAHLRRCFGAGLTAVVAHKGAPEAGAVYIQVTIAPDQVKVFAPEPGPTYNEDGQRNWYMPLGSDPVSDKAAAQYFKRQKSFDPDIWIIDIDDRSGSGLLDL